MKRRILLGGALAVPAAAQGSKPEIDALRKELRKTVVASNMNSQTMQDEISDAFWAGDPSAMREMQRLLDIGFDLDWDTFNARQRRATQRKAALQLAKSQY